MFFKELRQPSPKASGEIKGRVRNLFFHARAVELSLSAVDAAFSLDDMALIMPHQRARILHNELLLGSLHVQATS